MNKNRISVSGKGLTQMVLALLVIFAGIYPAFADNRYKDPVSGCAVLAPKFLDGKSTFSYQGGCKAGLAEGNGKASWSARDLHGNPLVWEGTFKEGNFVARTKPSTVAGVYSMFDDNFEMARLMLAKNGHFIFGFNFVLGTLTQISDSWDGRWEENKKDGSICFTAPPPLPLLFGRWTADEVEPDEIRVQIKGRANGFLSWGDGPKDQVFLSPYTSGNVFLKAGTPILNVAILDTEDGEEESEETPSRIYRHTLNPKYNDYELILRKEDKEDLFPLLDLLVFGRVSGKEKDDKPMPKSSTVCGTIAPGIMDADGKIVPGLMRRNLTQQEGGEFSKALAERADPLTFGDKIIYTRVRGERVED